MKTPVSIIFSKNKKIGSWLIRLGTTFLSKNPLNRVPSHVAILIANRWVFESVVVSGVRVVPIKTWLEQNELIASISWGEVKYSKLKYELKASLGKKYDYLGLIYFSWRIFLYICLNISFPKRNAGHNPHKYFCSEVVGKITKQDYSLKAPVQIMDELINI